MTTTLPRLSHRYPTLLLLVGTLAPLAGCMDWTYRGLEIGAGPADYDRVLPAENRRQTPLGLAYIGPGAAWEDRSDAVVLLLGDDRRLAGKWQATAFTQRKWFRATPGYRLRGAVDPARLDLDQATPIDALRFLFGRLMETGNDTAAYEAHGAIAAGIVRLLERWPGEEDFGALSGFTLRELDETTGAGTVQLTIDPGGVFHFRYEEGARLDD